jgi:hypothetical protein
MPGMDPVAQIALAGGLAWASGIRLYAVLFIAGLLGRAGYLALPAHLAVLQEPLVLGVAGIMLVAEFVADKVPAFDSAWDAVHTFIRVPAGAVLAAAALGDLDPAWVAVAAILGGTIASAAHATKAGSRALINASPEPFSNWTASFAEDLAVPVGFWLAVQYPMLFLGLLVAFLALAAWLLPKLWRGLRALVARIGRVFA